MAAERELGVDPLLDRGEAELVEPLGLDPGERLELEIGERPSVPQRLRVAQQRGRAAAASPSASASRPSATSSSNRSRSSSPGLDPEQVAGRAAPRAAARPPSAGREHLAQARDVVAQRVVGRVRRSARRRAPSIRRSRETTRFALSSSSASNARCFGPPTAIGKPSTRTVSGPSSRNSRRLTAIAPEVSSASIALAKRPGRLWDRFGTTSRRRIARDAVHGQMLLARRDRGRASRSPSIAQPITAQGRRSSAARSTSSGDELVLCLFDAPSRDGCQAGERARRACPASGSSTPSGSSPERRGSDMKAVLTIACHASLAIAAVTGCRAGPGRTLAALGLRRRGPWLLRDDSGRRRRGARRRPHHDRTRHVRRRRRDRQEHRVPGCRRRRDGHQRRRPGPHDRRVPAPRARRLCRSPGVTITGRGQRERPDVRGSAAVSSSHAAPGGATGATVTISDSVITGNRATPTVAAPVGPTVPRRLLRLRPRRRRRHRELGQPDTAAHHRQREPGRRSGCKRLSRRRDLERRCRHAHA